VPCAGIPARSVPQCQFVTQQVAARLCINGGSAAPTAAAHLAGDSLASRRHGFGEHFAQIKIAPDAFMIVAVEAENGLGVLEVDGVLDLTVARATF